MDQTSNQPASASSLPHRRRPRYPGKYPRKFQDKYKEHSPGKFPDTIRKVIESGKTPAGSHRSIMVEELMNVLSPRPGELAVDCTLGYGGHACELLPRLAPGGRLIGLDLDPIELSKTEARLRGLGFGADVFVAVRSNFAGLATALSKLQPGLVDIILADLGASSMQLDNPARGFSFKVDGPLDMRMNPSRGQPAATFLERVRAEQLFQVLVDGADEPRAELLAAALAGHRYETTRALVLRIKSVLTRLNSQDLEQSIRRTFQALRIAVNDEFSALDALMRQLPSCLKPGGRVAILSFHSGEDRRVKKAFAAGLRDGVFVEASHEVLRASPAECAANPRATSAKLRWARASDFSANASH